MKKLIIMIISLCFVLSLNIYFRLFPANFPQLKTQARETVEKKVYQEITKKVNNDYLDFNIPSKNKLIEQGFNKYTVQNKEKFKADIQKEYNKLKDIYQDEKGQTYLMELDCWHWAKYTENTYLLGHPGDKVVNGKQMDSLMLAPYSSELPWSTFLFELSSRLYKIYSIFNKSISLQTFLFYLPLFYLTIFIILLYLFCYIHWGNLCAIISCFYVGLAPIFLPRSSAGWFDMDILNLLFPIAIVWAYLAAYKKPLWKSAGVWICLSAFLTTMFCLTWIDWWFILLIIVLYEIISLFNLSLEYFKGEKNIPGLLKKHLLALTTYTTFTFIFIVIILGFRPITTLYIHLKQALHLNNLMLNNSIWPNVLSTVSELKKPGLLRIIELTGGIPLFISGLACLLLLFYRYIQKQKCSEFERETKLILVIWFLAMFFACTKGARFIIFILVPLGISLGWILNEAYKYFNNTKKIVALFVLAIAFVLFSENINNAIEKSTQIFPLMNDHYYKVLKIIDRETPQNTIINSWWDFGDWFKTIAKRRVIFDGQSQNIPQAYWLARVFLINNEEEAINILRMLNNGGNEAFNIIDKELKNPYKSVLLIKKALSLDIQNAKKTFSDSLGKKTADKIIKLIFSKPDPAYFIVDYSLMNKISSISFVGNWNFIRSYIAKNIDKKSQKEITSLVEELISNKKIADNLYRKKRLTPKNKLDSWISQKTKFYGEPLDGQIKGETVFFDNGLVYNPKAQTISLYSCPNRKYKTPVSLFTFDNGTLNEFTYPENNIGLSVLMFKDKENYQSILLNPKLAESLFVRLYFLKGEGLKHFKPFLEEKTENGYIRVYEIIWD